MRFYVISRKKGVYLVEVCCLVWVCGAVCGCVFETFYLLRQNEFSFRSGSPVCSVWRKICTPRHTWKHALTSRIYFVSLQNVQWARDVLLGSSVPWQQLKHMPAQGLFCERNKTNLFNVSNTHPTNTVPKVDDYEMTVCLCVLKFGKQFAAGCLFSQFSVEWIISHGAKYPLIYLPTQKLSELNICYFNYKSIILTCYLKICHKYDLMSS